MKRSRAVSLVLLGAAGAAAYGLAAWTGGASDEVGAELFTGGGDCAAGGHDAAFCGSAAREAEARHVTDAPRFEGQADCERDFGPGACAPTRVQGPGGAVLTYFVPAMVGYAVARSLAGGSGPVAQPLYACPPERRRPNGACYSTSSGRSVYTGSSSGSFSSGSASRSARAEQRVPAGTFDRPASGGVVVRQGGSVGSISRGGFGGTGHAVASAHSGGS